MPKILPKTLKQPAKPKDLDPDFENLDKDDRELEEEEEIVDAIVEPTTPSNPTPVLPRQVDKAAEAIRASRALPKPPGKMVDFDTMIQWLNLLTKDMWSHVLVYVYRHLPVIDRLKIDPQGVKYIDVISEPPVTLDYMVDKHGGGKYGFMVKDTDKNNSDDTKLFESKLSISMSQHEPVLDLRELDINHRDNIAYVQTLRAQRRLDERGNPMEPNKFQQNPANGGMDSNAMVSLVKEFMGMFQRMNADQQANLKSRINSEEDSLGKSIGNLLLEKMKQDDPKSFITMLTGLMGAMKSQTGESGSQAATMMDRVIQMQADHNKAMMDMMKLQFEANQKQQDREPEEKKSPIDQLKELLELAKMIKGGGNVSADRGIADIALDYVKELGVPLLSTINNIIGLRKGQAPGMPIVNPNPQMLQQPVAIPAATGIADPTNPIVEQPTTNQLIPLINQFGGILINKIQSGIRGWEFAEDLVRFYGPAPHAMVAKFGIDGVIATFKQVPELWNQLEPVWGEEYLKKWVEEFINYEEILAKMEEEENVSGEVKEPEVEVAGTVAESPAEKLYKKGRKVSS